jgi:hypothetical protein
MILPGISGVRADEDTRPGEEYMALPQIPAGTLELVFEQVAQQLSRQMDDIESLTAKAGLAGGVTAGIFAAFTAGNVPAHPDVWRTLAVVLLLAALLLMVCAIFPAGYSLPPHPRALFSRFLRAEREYVLLHLGQAMARAYENNERTLRLRWRLLKWALLCVAAALVMVAIRFALN